MNSAFLTVQRLTRDRSGDALESRRLRDDFPILSQTVNGRRLVYLDNAASAQKPSSVLDAMRDAYELHYANVHRGVHTLSQRSTEAFEAARRKVADFINARRATEIVFVRGATEAINLVASTLGRKMLRRDRPFGARAPLEHRALATAARRKTDRAEGGADR